MISHEFYICRALYQEARQKGAPVVNVMRLAPETFVAETADKKILNENASGCCKWAIKYDLASEWLDVKENK